MVLISRSANEYNGRGSFVITFNPGLKFNNTLFEQRLNPGPVFFFYSQNSSSVPAKGERMSLLSQI